MERSGSTGSIPRRKREELQGLIGYLPQEFGMYENMSAYAYLDYLAVLKGITDTQDRRKRIREVLDSVHMWDAAQEKDRSLFRRNEATDRYCPGPAAPSKDTGG